MALQGTIEVPDYVDAFRNSAYCFTKSEDFADALHIASEVIASPGPRRKAEEEIVKSWGKSDYSAAFEWAKEKPLNEIADYMWALGLPEYIEDGMNVKAQADWILSLDPDPESNDLRGFKMRLIEGWMGYDPAAATQWLIENEQVDHNIVTPMLTKMSAFYWKGNPELEHSEWRENAAVLLKMLIHSGEESAEGLRSRLEVFDCPKEVRDFVEEVIRQP